MKTYNFPQQSQEWFDIRLGKFTASNAQAIASNGKGLETLCFQVVAEILSKTREEGYTNPDLERGNEQETLARASYEMETGNKVETVGFCELNDRVGASPDGLVGEDGLVEIKCQKNSVYVQTLYSKKIDTKYEWQMQMQMLVTDRKWVDFVVFNENFPKLIIIRVNRDEAKIEKLRVGLEMGNKKVDEILEGVK